MILNLFCNDHTDLSKVSNMVLIKEIKVTLDLFCLQPWSENFCRIQSFCHTLSNSVQVLIFPVIGIERWYSIESPFETTKNLRRVNYLNGKSLLFIVLKYLNSSIFNPKLYNHVL